MVAQIVSKSVPDRALFIGAIESLFSEQVYFPQVLFSNISFTVSKIYDSYFIIGLDDHGKPVVFQDLQRIRKLARFFCKKV
jgi:hypothetical protein